MFKFKDLYVHLAPEVPAKGAPEAPAEGAAAEPGGVLAWFHGGGIVRWDRPPCQVAPSQSTPICDIPGVLKAFGEVAGGTPLALKDFLKSALDKAAQEPQNMHDAEELQQLEDKLSDALKEVSDRKNEVIKSKAAAAAK